MKTLNKSDYQIIMDLIEKEIHTINYNLSICNICGGVKYSKREAKTLIKRLEQIKEKMEIEDILEFAKGVR